MIRYKDSTSEEKLSQSESKNFGLPPDEFQDYGAFLLYWNVPTNDVSKISMIYFLNPFTLEFWFETNFKSLFSCATAFSIDNSETYTISEVYYEASIITITDSNASNEIRKDFLEQGLVLNYTDWNTYTNPVQGTDIS